MKIKPANTVNVSSIPVAHIYSHRHVLYSDERSEVDILFTFSVNIPFC